jgi:hypothetical protein
MYVMTHHFFHIICIVSLWLYLKWFYLIHIFIWYFVHSYHFFINYVCHMDEICNEKTTSAFLLPRHRLLIKGTTNIWLKKFTHKIWNNILLLQSIISCLEHLIIKFLVAKDKIFLMLWGKVIVFLKFENTMQKI